MAPNLSSECWEDRRQCRQPRLWVRHYLGHLTLLEKPINIVASNDFYRDKTAEYRKSKNYLTSSLPELTTVGNNSSINRMNAKLRAFPEWTADSIEKRHQMLIDLAGDAWRTEALS